MVRLQRSDSVQSVDGMIEQTPLSPFLSPPADLDLELMSSSDMAIFPSPMSPQVGKVNPLRRSVVLEMDAQRREALEARGRHVPNDVQAAEELALHLQDTESATHVSPQQSAPPLRLRPQPTGSFDMADATCTTCRTFETPRRQERALVAMPKSPLTPSSSSSCQLCQNDTLTTFSGTSSVAASSLPESFILHAPDAPTRIASSFALLGLQDDDSSSCEELETAYQHTESAFRRVPLRPRQVVHHHSHSDPLSPISGAALSIGTSDGSNFSSFVPPPRPLYAMPSVPMIPDGPARFPGSPLHEDSDSPLQLFIGGRVDALQQHESEGTPPSVITDRRQSIPYLPTTESPDVSIGAVSLPPSPSAKHVQKLISRSI